MKGNKLEMKWSRRCRLTDLDFPSDMVTISGNNDAAGHFKPCERNDGLITTRPGQIESREDREDI